MTMQPPDWRLTMTNLKVDIGLLEAATIPIQDMPDAAGMVRAIEVRLADLRHGWNTEQVQAAKDPESEFGPSTLKPERSAFGTVQPQVVGREFRTVTTRTAKRTYNTAPILIGLSKALAEDDTKVVTPIDALTYAIRERAAEVTWKWTALTRLARDLGLPLKVAKGPIADDGDLDGPWVGEDWRETVTQQAIVPEEAK
jgi:hypothetical protein